MMRPAPVESRLMSTLSDTIASTNTVSRYRALPGVRFHHSPYVAHAERGCRSVVVVVIGLSLVRLQGGLLPGFDDQELSHHALVLVPQQVAVIHVRRRRVGVVLEADEQSVLAV